MTQFNLADRLSSTLVYATDSLDDMVEFVSAMVDDDGVEALDGLSLSMPSDTSSRYDSFADAQMLPALQAQHEKAHGRTHRQA